MKTHHYAIVPAIFAVLLLTSCTSTPPGNRSARTGALIVSGDVVSYSSTAVNPRVSVIDVDGKPVKEPYGPVELAPGRHTVNLGCNGTSSSQTITAAAGEIYQFAARIKPGVKGCTGALTRMHTSKS
jgi:hypothetical protein